METTTCATRPSRPSTGHLDPRWGQDRIYHGRGPAGLVHLPPAGLGRPHRRLSLQGLRRAAPHPGDLRPSSAASSQQEGADIWFTTGGGTAARRDALRLRRRGLQEGDGHPGRLVRFRGELCRGAGSPTRTWPCPPTSTSRAATSTGAGSTVASSTSVGTRGQAPYQGVLTHGFVVDGDGGRCPNPWATSSPPRKSSRSTAPRSSGSGWRPRTTATTSASRRDPGAARRGLSPDPKHQPVHAGQPLRLRPGAPPVAPETWTRSTVALSCLPVLAGSGAYDDFEFHLVFHRCTISARST